MRGSARANISWYSENAASHRTSWAIVAIWSTGALAAVFASILGAAAMPTTSEFESVQSSLLTRLKPIDICSGRLIAGIWIPVTMILASAAFWLTDELYASRDGTAALYRQVVSAHITILLFTLVVAAAAFGFSVKRRPGSSMVRGFCTALAIGAICISASWLINPIIVRLNNPGTLIEATLTINPAVSVATGYNVDILREEWLYDHIRAQDYPFYYPGAPATCMLFLAAGCGALILSAAALKRAYR